MEEVERGERGDKEEKGRERIERGLARRKAQRRKEMDGELLLTSAIGSSLSDPASSAQVCLGTQKGSSHRPQAGAPMRPSADSSQ